MDGVFQINGFRGRDLQRIGRIVGGQHHAVAVHNGAATGGQGQHGDAVVFCLSGQLFVLIHLQMHEPRKHKAKTNQYKCSSSQQPQTKTADFLFSAVQFDHLLTRAGFDRDRARGAAGRAAGH